MITTTIRSGRAGWASTGTHSPSATRGGGCGIDGVVLADASLIPVIPRANTNMPAVMTGERVAGFLLGDS